MVLYNKLDLSKLDLSVPTKTKCNEMCGIEDNVVYKSNVMYNGKEVSIQSEGNLDFKTFCDTVVSLKNPEGESFTDFLMSVKNHFVELIEEKSEEFFKKKFSKEIIEQRFDNEFKFICLDGSVKTYDHLGELITFGEDLSNELTNGDFTGTIIFNINSLVFTKQRIFMKMYISHIKWSKPKRTYQHVEFSDSEPECGGEEEGEQEEQIVESQEEEPTKNHEEETPKEEHSDEAILEECKEPEVAKAAEEIQEPEAEPEDLLEYSSPKTEEEIVDQNSDCDFFEN